MHFIRSERWTAILFVVLGCRGVGIQPDTQPGNTAPVVTPGAVTQQNFAFGEGASYPYLVFTPTAWTAQKHMPVLLLIHGAGGNGADMLDLWRSFADQQGIILVAPTFPLDAQWETSVPQLFPALMDAVKQSLNFDASRVYVFGYSAGSYSAFDAATLSATYFASAGVFAGIISPNYDSIVTAAKRKTPIAIYIGDHDQYFTVAETRRTRDLLISNGFPVHYVEIPNQDHNYPAISAYVNSDVWSYMSQYSLP